MIIVIAVSCGRNDNIFDGKLTQATSEEHIELTGYEVNLEKMVYADFSTISIVDSLLVLKSSGKGKDGHFFHLYSLPDMKYAGSHIALGRGANELLKPFLSGRRSKNTNGIYVFDLQLCSAYEWDIYASINGSSDAICKLCGLPARTLDAFPLHDTLNLAKIVKVDDVVYRLVGADKKIYDEYSLYPGISGMLSLDKVSSSDCISPDGSKIAMAMCFIPQINILDLENKEKNTIAVSKEYRNWRKVLASENSELTLHYQSIAATSEYIYALYSGTHILDWIQGEAEKSHIQVFKWNGRFVCDFALGQVLQHICVWQETGEVYGLDVDGNIYRYRIPILN